MFIRNMWYVAAFAADIEGREMRWLGLLLRLRNRGMTSIVVDQRLDTVFDTCSEVCMMSWGNIAVRSTSAELRTQPALLAEHLNV